MPAPRAASFDLGTLSPYGAAAYLHEVVVHIQGIIKLVVIQARGAPTPAHIECLLLASSCTHMRNWSISILTLLQGIAPCSMLMTSCATVLQRTSIAAKSP